MAEIGAVPVKVPRVRDRGDEVEKIRFTSTILPPFLRKTKSIEDLLPLAVSSQGHFQEALAALLGPNAAGLSSTTISRLKAGWWEEYDRWQRRGWAILKRTASTVYEGDDAALTYAQN